MTPSIVPDASRVATIVLLKYPSIVAPVERRVRVGASRAVCESPVRKTCSSTARWLGSGSISANRLPITSFSVSAISELQRTHDREPQVLAEEHADSGRRVAKRLVQTEALALGLVAGRLELDVRPREATAEIPRDPECGEDPDEREQDRRAGEPIGERERGGRRLREDDDPTGARRRREGDEVVAAAVARQDGVRDSCEALSHLRERVLIGESVGAAPWTDELVSEPIDDAEVDRRSWDDIVQLAFDVREGKGSR